MIYLDNAATTFPKPEKVYETMDYYIRNKCVNAGRGSYRLAREAVELINETRDLIRELVNVNKNEEVIFTPSATIAINHILNSQNWKEIRNVFVTPFEHNAIMRTLYNLKKIYNFEITVIPFSNEGLELQISSSKILFSEKKPELVLMSHVSNVTGYILPIDEIIKLAKFYNENVITLVDASQSLGVVDLNMSSLECDFVVFAGHKSLYGPYGIAGFIKGINIDLKSFIIGGTGSDSTNLEMPQEGYGKYEAGSYNMHSISGLNAALKWIKDTGRENIYYHKKELTDSLVDMLSEISGVDLYIPKNKENHIGIVSITVEGFKNDEVGNILNDEFDIAVRTGHHCAPLISEFLDLQEGSVRISLGYFNTKEDICKLVEAIEDILGE